MSAAAPESPVTPGLSAARLDELVDKTQEAMDAVLSLLIDAVHEDGHNSSRLPEGQKGLGPCVLCSEPWPCQVATRAMHCGHGTKKALLALGADRQVIENVGFRHRPRPAQ